MPKPVIAIDGPAASGKGTLGLRLADALNYAYMDTGALYRAVAFQVITSGLSPRDRNDARDAAQILLKKIERSVSPNDILGDSALRDDEIGQAASIVAAYGDVREILKDIQRRFAKNPGARVNGAILDGRDIGTVICPDADLKFFITADDGVRAKRRLKELQSKGITVTYGDVLEDLRARDARDASRKDAPMVAADDAITIDTSDLDADESFKKVFEITKERLAI